MMDSILCIWCAQGRLKWTKYCHLNEIAHSILNLKLQVTLKWMFACLCLHCRVTHVDCSSVCVCLHCSFHMLTACLYVFVYIAELNMLTACMYVFVYIAELNMLTACRYVFVNIAELHMLTACLYVFVYIAVFICWLLVCMCLLTLQS